MASFQSKAAAFAHESSGGTRKAGGAGETPAAEYDWQDDTQRSGLSKIIELGRIDPDETQARKEFDPVELAELAENIRENDLIQAIMVRPGPAEGRFTIIAGERRYRAALLAGLKVIRAEVRENLTPAKVKFYQVTENLMRADLKPIEQAAAFRELMTVEGSEHPTAAKLAALLKVNEVTVGRALALLALPEWVHPLIVRKSPEGQGGAGGTMTPTQAYEISKAPAEMHDALCRRVLAEGLTVAQIAEGVAGVKQASPAERSAKGAGQGRVPRARADKGGPILLKPAVLKRLSGRLLAVDPSRAKDMVKLADEMEAAVFAIREQVAKGGQS